MMPASFARRVRNEAFSALVVGLLGAGILPPSFPEETPGPGTSGSAGAADDLVAFSPAQRKLMEALVLAEEERYAEAIPILEPLIREDPTLLGAWQALGWAYWKTGRGTETESLWERLRALNPDLPEVYAWLASVAVYQKDLDKASRLLERALELSPKSFDYRLDYARVQLWRGRLGVSVRLLRALLVEDPDRLDIALELARALQYSWRFEEARPIWKRLLDVAPDVAEYRLGLALALLHTGEREKAVEIARSVLDEDPRNIAALRIIADDAEYGLRPEQALPWLYRAIEAADDQPDERRAVRLRLVTLLVRLHERSPRLHPLDAPIRVSRDRVRDEPGNVDARLLLAELLLMDRRFEDSESEFYIVLREHNPNNLRAHRGLYEIALARFRFAEAREHLDRIRAFNPNDPYLLVDEAMWYARMGDFKRAHACLDELERRGGRGAVAVLRYQALTPGDIGPALPVTRFREHLAHLAKVGYRFLTPDEIPDYFERVGSLPDRVAGLAPTRAVVVTFDGAMEPTMALATSAAQEHGVVLAQFVPVAEVERGDPLAATWSALREYRRSGRWTFGSLMWDAHSPARVYRADAPSAAPLANRIQQATAERVETFEEFMERLRNEYQKSRDVLAERIRRPIHVAAYPEGDIGQRGASNEPQAPMVNIAEAERFYRLAFLIRPQGHAVATDSPYHLPRYEPPPWLTGEELVNHLLQWHPVFLAQRRRLEFACFQARRLLARRTLEQMERSGYPESEIRRLDRFIQARLARKFDIPEATEDTRKGPWHILLEQPYVGAHARWFEDSLDTTSLRYYGEGGLHVMSHLVASARVGVGRHEQPRRLKGWSGGTAAVTNAPPAGASEKIHVDERFYGAEASALLPRHLVLFGGLDRREFSGDAQWDLLRYNAGFSARLHETLEMKLDYDHDAVPGGRALVRQLTQNRLTLNGVWSPTDRWELWGAWQNYDFSDNNGREHWYLNPMYLVWQDAGLRLGLRYEEVDAEQRDSDYWTPFNLRSLYFEAGFRGAWRRHYYSLIARAGIAKEGVRPEDWKAYNDLVALYERLQKLSRSQKWPKSARKEVDDALDDLRRNPPKEDWEPVFGAEAQWIFRWGRHWELLGLLAYGESPEYHELHAGGGVRYRF